MITNNCFMVKKKLSKHWMLNSLLYLYHALYTNSWKQKQSTLLMTCVIIILLSTKLNTVVEIEIINLTYF